MTLLVVLKFWEKKLSGNHPKYAQSIVTAVSEGSHLQSSAGQRTTTDQSIDQHVINSTVYSHSRAKNNQQLISFTMYKFNMKICYHHHSEDNSLNESREV